MASYGHTFTSGDTVTPTKLNNARTVSDIVNADIKSDAAIAGTKIDPNFGSQNSVTTGTVTAAKLIPTGTSATGNGMYLPAANSVAISTNGSERLRIDSSGNMAIGATSASARLDVAGPASVTGFTGSTRLGLTVRGSTSATDYSGIDLSGNNQTIPTARIAVLTEGNGSLLSFGTSNNYTNGITNTALTINNVGNVGIAKTNPSTALDVSGTVTATAFAGNLTGNVTGDLTGTASAIANGAVSAANLSGAQTGSAPVYGCRAWVNFDGTTTPPTIRASGNVTSVTKNATGDYTINFTTAMPDANYSFTASGSRNNSLPNTIVHNNARTNTTSALNILSLNSSSGAAINESHICIHVFR